MEPSVRIAVVRVLRIPVMVIIGNVIVVAQVLQLWKFSIKKTPTEPHLQKCGYTKI